MLLRLLILLTVVPLVELSILLRLAQRFNWGPTIALVLVTGALGAWLARREGLRTLRRIQADLAAGVAPTNALIDAALIVVAGVVLVTPGILTDLAGFALLIAPIRRRVRRRLVEAFKRRMVVTRHGAVVGGDAGTSNGPSEFIDVAVTSEKAAGRADRPDS